MGSPVTPDGKHAYITGGESNSVSVIDTTTNMVVATVAVETFPIGVAITPDGRHAYVAGDLSNNVSVIATASNTVVVTIPVGSGPFGVAVNVQRHLTSARTHRAFRASAMNMWREAVAVV
jgi:YVTN family beta-propeller protein